jgi:hypothetical protein
MAVVAIVLGNDEAIPYATAFFVDGGQLDINYISCNGGTYFFLGCTG